MQIRTALPCQDAGPWKVLESVAAGRAEHLNGTGVGFASSCFFTDTLNASKSQGPRSAQRVWPHTGHLHTCTFICMCVCECVYIHVYFIYSTYCQAYAYFKIVMSRLSPGGGIWWRT